MTLSSRTAASIVPALCLGVALSACNGSTPEPKSDPTRASASSAEAEPAPAPAPAPTAPAGRLSDVAYINVEGVGVHRIDEQGFASHYGSRAAIRDMITIGERLYVISAFGIERVGDDGPAETLAEIDRGTYTQLGEPRVLASADGRVFWIVGDQGLGRFESGWTVTPLTEITQTPAAPEQVDLALATTGEPWLTAGRLLKLDNERWTPVDLPPLSFPAHPREIERRGASFLIHAGCSDDGTRCAVIAPRDAAIRHEISSSTCADLGQLAISPDGKLAALGGRCGLVRLKLGTDELASEPIPTSASGWTGQPLSSLAIDDGGRIWAGTNAGLTIVDASNTAAEYPIAQLTDMSGPVTAIVVGGGGPPPPPLGLVRYGKLEGTVVTREGTTKQPVADAEIELCAKLSTAPDDPARSPCAGVEPTHATTTDPRGHFAVEKLAIAHYHVAARIDGRWAVGMPKAVNMRGGMGGNVGNIVVE